MTVLHGDPGSGSAPGSAPADGAVTCGQATMRLLAAYGVDHVYGIPGVHTLDFCRGLAASSIRHVQARNEQGAGFMADGYARATGRPGVALVISGPGVTNALTAIGQSWADSVPVLLLSSEAHSSTLHKGWGVLHEIPDQRAVTEPLTALSMRARHPNDVPEMLAQAFGVFTGARPRPVHLSIPLDVLAMPVREQWHPVRPPGRPVADPALIERAVALLESAERPVLMVGGGAVEAAAALLEIVERLAIPVVASTAGKGIIADDHGLSLSASTVRPEVQRWLADRDVIVAVGTELAETDSFVDRLPLDGSIIRVDVDPAKLNDQYPCTVGIVADASDATERLAGALSAEVSPDVRAAREAEIAAVRAEFMGNLTETEAKHSRLLVALGEALSDEAVLMGDICQLVYTGGFAMDRRRPRTWHYPAGFCTLGCGLPNAIGAKQARPQADVVCLAGDGGFMFTVQELMTASEQRLGIPVVIWANGGLKQIQDDMNARGIPLVGVTGANPDFVQLAEAMGCDGVIAESLDHTVTEVTAALTKDHPTVIVVEEQSPWLD